MDPFARFHYGFADRMPFDDLSAPRAYGYARSYKSGSGAPTTPADDMVALGIVCALFCVWLYMVYLWLRKRI